MPRLNDVFLTGLVSDTPSVKYDKSGTAVQAAIEVVTIHGKRRYGDNIITADVHMNEISNKGFDSLWIMTKDEGMIDEILKCKPYDLIEVKGMLRVQEVLKKATCPECEIKNTYRSRRTAVYPIYFSLIESVAEKYGVRSFAEQVPRDVEEKIRADSLQKLKNRIEISNVIKLIGVACRQPELYQRDTDKKMMLSFPFAVKRKYYIAEDDMRTNVDFPFIKIYGDEAKKQYDALEQGNLLLIDGFISSRNITRKLHCDNCKAAFPVADTVSEVVPYSIEYLRRDISDVPEQKEKTGGYLTNMIGSEPDIDLRNQTPEQISDEKIAAGYTPSTKEEEIIIAVSKMED